MEAIFSRVDRPIGSKCGNKGNGSGEMSISHEGGEICSLIFLFIDNDRGTHKVHKESLSLSFFLILSFFF